MNEEMTFEEAIRELKEGHRIRRKLHQRNSFLTFNRGKVVFISGCKERAGYPYSFDESDICANDWEIYTQLRYMTFTEATDLIKQLDKDDMLNSCYLTHKLLELGIYLHKKTRLECYHLDSLYVQKEEPRIEYPNGTYIIKYKIKG